MLPSHLREARSILARLKADGVVKVEQKETLQVVAAAMAVVREPSRSVCDISKQHGVLYQRVYEKLGAVRALVKSRSETGPAPRRGLEGNRIAMLEHASVHGPPGNSITRAVSRMDDLAAMVP